MQARAAAVSHDVGGAALADFTGINEVPLNPVVEAAHHWLQSWLETGTPPPIQPRLEFAGDPAEVQRDINGIARGGIRLPQVEVPLATNSAVPAAGNPLGFLGGSCVPFTASKVRALYENVDTYLSRFEQATRAAAKAGVLLARDVEPLLAEARDAYQRAIAEPSPVEPFIEDP
jgi:hypothetical protein